jgi:hypothetical protein
VDGLGVPVVFAHCRCPGLMSGADYRRGVCSLSTRLNQKSRRGGVNRTFTAPVSAECPAHKTQAGVDLSRGRGAVLECCSRWLSDFDRAAVDNYCFEIRASGDAHSSGCGMIGFAAPAYTGPVLLRRFLPVFLRSIRQGQPDLITVGGSADGHEGKWRALRGLPGSEVVELDKQGCCRTRVDDHVMLVAHGIPQHQPYRAAHVLKALAGALQAFTGAPFRSIMLRSNTLAPTLAKALSIVSAAAVSGFPALPSPALSFADAPGQCSLFEMFRLSAA